MSSHKNADITMLIGRSREGDRDAHDQLFELVYDELREIARRSRFVSNQGQTMQATALANEAYMFF